MSAPSANPDTVSVIAGAGGPPARCPRWPAGGCAESVAASINTVNPITHDRAAFIVSSSARRSGPPKHRQVGPPGPNGVSVAPRHHPDDLSEVTEIVRHPCRQLLTHGDDAELRMAAAAIEIRVGQLQSLEANKALSAHGVELVEQFDERSPL